MKDRGSEIQVAGGAGDLLIELLSAPWHICNMSLHNLLSVFWRTPLMLGRVDGMILREESSW